jgi:hypothetical protein
MPQGCQPGAGGERSPSSVAAVDLVLIHGLPAAGKLTTARQLSELVGVPVFFNNLTVPRY